MNDSDTKIRVGLDDKASGGLDALASKVKNFGDSVKNTTAPVNNLGTSFAKLTASFTAANLATQGITQGFGFLIRQFHESIAASNKMTSAMIGLSSVAGAFGESQDRARDSAKALASDGLLTVGEAADGLKNLLGAGLNLDEATNLMYGFKDAAAFNRQGTLDFGQAIVGATQGIKNQNSIMVDNVGVTKNLSVIMKEAGLSIDDLSKVSTDAGVKQKFLNGLLRETSVFAGDAARAASTLQGAQTRLNTSVTILQANIGAALTPAISQFIDYLNNFANKANNAGTPALVNFAKAGVVVVTVLQNMIAIVHRAAQSIGSTLIKPISAIINLIRGDFDAAFQDAKATITGSFSAFGDLMGDFDKNGRQMVMTLNKIDTEGLSAFGDIFREKLEKMPALVDETARKIAEQIAKVNRDFQQAMQDKLKDFDDSLKDLVLSHREKVKQLEKDLGEENDDFNRKMQERALDFNEAMVDIEDRHAEKVKTISDQMETERKKVDEEVKRINNKYAESIQQFKSGMDKRLTDLQVALDKEVGKGQFANQAKIINLEQMLINERKALEDQLALKEQILEDEKQQVIDEHKDRFNELQQNLDDETASVKKAKEDKIKDYEEETAALSREHNKRLTALNDELNTERALQKKYAEDFARFQDAVAEDDIARLKRRFAEEKEVMEREHQDRLNDIARQAQEERATREAAQVRADTSAASRAAQNSQQAAQAVNQSAAKVSQQLSAQVSKSLATPQPVAQSSAQINKNASSSNIFTTIGNAVNSVISTVRSWLPFAEGGIVTKPTRGLVGESGPEAIIPLSNPSRANAVINDLGLGNRNISLNMPVTVVSSAVDLDMIFERAAFQLNKKGLL